MKFIFLSILLVSGLHAAPLKFEEAEKEIHADINASSVKADFNFTNTSSKAVKIQKVDAGCSCLAAEIWKSKLDYAPGESGILRATFEIGTFQGAVDKPIFIWLEGDPEDEPSQSVNLRVHIPVIIALEPKTLKWATGDSKTTKSIKVTMDYKNPINIKKVSTSNSNFTTKVVTLKEGKEYLVEVTPTQTEAAGLSVVRIETDVDISKHRIQQGFAVVSTPIKK